MFKRIGEELHGGEKRSDLLHVMFDVIGFLAKFGDDVQCIGALFPKPAMARVELVSEYEPQALIRGCTGHAVLAR